MKKLLMIVMILMTISFNANAGFLTGYVVGRGTKHCSCVNEKEQIEQLKKENKDLKEEINKLISMMEKQNEEKEAETNKKD